MTTPEDDVAVVEDTPTPVRHASRTPTGSARSC